MAVEVYDPAVDQQERRRKLERAIQKAIVIGQARRDAYPDWLAPDATDADPWWGVYGRLSDADDVDEIAKEDARAVAAGQPSKGVTRQLRDGTDTSRAGAGVPGLAGAKRIRFYVDDGISASKRNVIRPAFELAVSELGSGPDETRYLVAWKSERLTRQPHEAEALLTALGDVDDIQATAITITDGVNTDSDHARYMFRQLVQFGNWESKAIGVRRKRKHLEQLEQGRFPGGPPAFGHKDKTAWREIEPSEADAIRDAATRVLAGEGVKSILRGWTAHDIKTRRGGSWQHPAWIKMMTSPRLAGLRILRGQEVNSGRIAPILEVDTWRDVRAILLDPARKPVPMHDGRPRHLLTGLMRCALCHSTLRAKGNGGKANGPGYWTYGCAKEGRPLACGRIWIKGDPTDRHIEGLVLALLRRPEVRDALMASAGQGTRPSDDVAALSAERIALHTRIVALESAHLGGTLEADFAVSADGYREYRTKALAQLDLIDTRLAKAARGRTVIAALLDPEAFWETAELGQRRDVIRAVLPEIVVHPAETVPYYPQRWDDRRISWTHAAG